jgi:hypothetical protein
MYLAGGKYLWRNDQLDKIVLDVICECVADRYDDLLSIADTWYYKLHPSLSPGDGKFFSQYFSKLFKKWAGSEAEFQSRGIDLSYINFDAMCSIGTTSAVRYAKDAHGENYNFILIDNEFVLRDIFGKILLLLAK